MKVISVVGARPQFIKLAPLQSKLREHFESIIVHSGQHYDDPLSAVFFRELSIPDPHYNLGVGSGLHGAQTGMMLKKLEEVFDFEKPDIVLVFGDTNTTLAGALAAAKLKIRLGHIEAGLRSFVKTMPEEINRVLTDKLSDLLFCPTETAVANLKREGIVDGVHLVGDLMHEALEIYTPVAERNSTILNTLALEPKKFILLTIHRAENTDDHDRLKLLIEDIMTLSHEIVFPVHPRTRKELMAAGLWPGLLERRNFVMIEPVSYFDNIMLVKNASHILTDSGGMQKEAFYFGIPTITLRNETEWPETVTSGNARLLLSNSCRGILGDFEMRNTIATKITGISPGSRILNVISPN